MRLRHQYLVLSLIIMALGTTSLLAGCGQKGDLYIPEQDQHDQRKEDASPKGRRQN